MAFLPGSLVDVRPVKDTTPFENKECDLKVINADVFCFYPVSYTHLDVYKRQVLAQSHYKMYVKMYPLAA